MRALGIENDRNEKDIVSEQDIKIYGLFHESDKDDFIKLKKNFRNKKIRFDTDPYDTGSVYEEVFDLVKEYDYIIIGVSTEFLTDLAMLEILGQNYVKKEKNKKIIPLIIDEKIYDIEERVKIVEKVELKVKSFEDNHYDRKFESKNEQTIHHLEELISLVDDFLMFACKMCRKSSKSLQFKVLNYIKYDRGFPVQEKKTKGKKELVKLENCHHFQFNNADGNSCIEAYLYNGTDN